MNLARGFEKAKEASKRSDFKSVVSKHLGSAVFYKGELLSVGYNSEKTHPIQHKFNYIRYKDDSCLPKIHAEVMALSKIRNLDIDFSKVDVFVYRESADGDPALARPCKSCEALIREMGIKKVHYTGTKKYTSERYV